MSKLELTLNEYGDLIGKMPANARVAVKGERRPDHAMEFFTVLYWEKGRPIKQRHFIGHDGARVPTKEELRAAAKAEAAQRRKSATDKERQHAAEHGMSLTAFRSHKRAAVRAELDLVRKESQARRMALGVSEGCPDDVCAILEEARGYGLALDSLDIAEAEDALMYSRRHKSSAFKSWQRGDLDPATLIRCVVGARRRYEDTDYDALLRSGMDKESARACAYKTW